MLLDDKKKVKSEAQEQAAEREKHKEDDTEQSCTQMLRKSVMTLRHDLRGLRVFLAVKVCRFVASVCKVDVSGARTWSLRDQAFCSSCRQCLMALDGVLQARMMRLLLPHVEVSTL
ncbi:hypothetical protein MRB53_037823 [Persea americana]|nr:hypothetical protein MRB53_037823 [Persea americana]